MEAYIVGGVRTAIGRFDGALAPLDAIELGSVVIRELVRRAAIEVEEVDEVIMGNVIQAGLGQNPARQSAVNAGLPEHVPSFTVNKVCGSGLKSVALAGQAIASGAEKVVIAGGMESMTNAPYVTKAMRWGQRLGNAEMVDTLINDSLWDKFYDCHMGITAENIALKYHVTREEQDEFAAHSQNKTEEAIKDGKFKDEIVPVMVKQPKGEDKIFDTDEHPRFGTTVESLAKLKPAFKSGGTITAGNASGINDGAGAVLVVSKEMMEGLKPQWAFRIVASQAAALDPAYMGLGPINACKALLKKAKLAVDDIDLVEVNEAFAAQSIQVNREMGWNLDKVNVLGGAIAIGHPVGASGTRILVTLLYEMGRRNVTLGLASLCIGGGQGIGMILERVK
ncbi:MAG TPA: acetyl-CoA C-acetyltransferase [Thermodesulfovibrionales bacterium]|jgi:acetyl-CoA C-acetyltransferase|nr:acetyl-CoA C-acetyltransferase [Thermodesulfovibrionales bacterium]